MFQLSTPVQLLSTVSIVGLPQRDVYDDMLVKFTGFGQTSNEGGASSVLLKVDSVIITSKKCQDDYASSWGLQLLPSHFCVKSHVRDPRTGQNSVSKLCSVSFLPFF